MRNEFINQDATMIRTAIFGVALTVLLSGCVGLMEPCSYQLQPYQGIAKPKSDEATVVFIFPGLKEMAYGFPVYQDGKLIGALRGSSYFYRTTTPSLHTFMIDRSTGDNSELTIALTTQAGKTHYVEFTPFGASPLLTIISEGMAMTKLPHLGWMQMNGDPKLIGVYTKDMLARQERGVH